MNQLPLRPNVCMLLFNAEKRLFLGERYGEPGIWQFPQGGAEPNLTLEENVIKELMEELGVNKDDVSIIKKLQATYEYDFRKTPDYAKGKWRGQSQTFWLVEFVGDDSAIKLDRDADPEFMDFGWFTIEEVLKKAEPVRVPGYRAALLEFESYINKLK